MEVISSDARVIGTVEGIGMDLSSWSVPALRIGMRRGVETLVGKRKRMLSVERTYISTLSVATVSDTIILRQPISEVGQAVLENGQDLTAAGAILGMRVVCKTGRYIGLIDNMVFDPDSNWSIPYFQVKLDRAIMEEMDMRKPFMSTLVVCIATAHVKAIGDMVMLSISCEELKDQVLSRPVGREAVCPTEPRGQPPNP